MENNAGNTMEAVEQEPRIKRMSISIGKSTHAALKAMSDLDGHGMSWHADRAIRDMLARELGEEPKKQNLRLVTADASAEVF